MNARDCGKDRMARYLFFFNNSIYSFILVVLGLHCCAGFSLAVAIGSHSLVVICWLLTEVSSLVAEHEP